MRSVPAEACHQVPRPLPPVWASHPARVLDGQRGGIHLLPGIFRQPVYQVCPQLLESAPEPADPPVKLALVRQSWLESSGSSFGGLPPGKRLRRAEPGCAGPASVQAGSGPGRRRRPDMGKQVGPPRSFWVEHNPISDRGGPLPSRIHIMRLRHTAASFAILPGGACPG